MKFSRLIVGLELAVSLAAAVPLASDAIKLLMKDGSYQLVKSYEVRRDRVRYYSIERSEWEEVPLSLVDLEATRRAQEAEKASQQKAQEEARELDKQRFDTPGGLGYEIVPGIHLPQEEGLFAFDGQRVIRMIQSAAEIVTDKKRAALLLALPAPVVKSRSLVVLRGPKAAVRISVSQPVFYVHFSDLAADRLELVPLKSGKQARVVEKVERYVVGKAGEVRSVAPLERAQVAPGLFKLTPARALAPGEYALGELVRQKLNLDLWDFGIDQGTM